MVVVSVVFVLAEELFAVAKLLVASSLALEVEGMVVAVSFLASFKTKNSIFFKTTFLFSF